MVPKLEAALGALREVVQVIDSYSHNFRVSGGAIIEFYRGLDEAIVRLVSALETVAEICNRECWTAEAERAEYYVKVCFDLISLLKELVTDYTVDDPIEEDLNRRIGLGVMVHDLSFNYHEKENLSGSVGPDVEDAAILEDTMSLLEKLFGILKGKLIRIWRGMRS